MRARQARHTPGDPLVTLPRQGHHGGHQTQFPGRRAFEAALAFVRGELPDLFGSLRVHLCAPDAWPPDAPSGSVAVFRPPDFLAVCARSAPVDFFVASLTHEALHHVQWAESGQAEEWCASDADEREAEEMGLAMAAACYRAFAPVKEGS